jgi:hypothetical protein
MHPMGLPPLALDNPAELIAGAGDVVLTHYELPHSVAPNLSSADASLVLQYALPESLCERRVADDVR